MVNIARRVWRRRDSWFVVSLLAASLAVNVYCIQRLRARAATPHLNYGIGAAIPTLHAKDSAGNRVVIDWATEKRPTLVYLFSPSCEWCLRNLSNIRTVAEARRAQYRFIGLSSRNPGFKGYFEPNALGFPVYWDAREDSGGEFRLGTLPSTLIVSPEGVVKESWHGAYVGRTQKDIEAKLGVRLPGLTQKAGGHDR